MTPPQLVVIDADACVQAIDHDALAATGLTVDAMTVDNFDAESERLAGAAVVLINDAAPRHAGLDVLRRLRALPAYAHTPVIFVTEPSDDEVISQCFTAGADDFIGKPVRPPELQARVRSILERQQMLVELREAASIDALTRLPNRATLQGELAAAMARAAGDPDYSFALLFLDFDRFKFVNDSLGHTVGDRLLQAIARRMRNNLRTTDTITRDCDHALLSRLGGDEFVVILEGVRDEHEVQKVVDRLLAVLAEPYELESHRITSTASIGVVLSAATYTSADDMLRDADAAMYAAKARGKGCYVMFDPAMRRAAVERLSLENELHDAIDSRAIGLAWQPIFSLDTGALVGVEALARWSHPERGAISPGVFIPIAEETRLIVPLGAQLLDRACARFAQWASALSDAPGYFSFNVSGTELRDPGFERVIDRTLAHHALVPAQLQLEMTESMIMEDPERSITLLQRLSARGIRLAMDDFGSGHSSLASLHRFPFDVIKIDRSFVAALDSDRHDFIALVHAVIELAWNLGIECVAEGIEDERQIAMLLAMDCALGQGFLLGAPAAGTQPPLSQWQHRPAAAGRLHRERDVRLVGSGPGTARSADPR